MFVLRLKYVSVTLWFCSLMHGFSGRLLLVDSKLEDLNSISLND